MLKVFLISGVLSVLTSIYTITVTDTDGSTISLSAFQGKKILIVNTASGSRYVSQYGELQQLHQTYGDSLVIIAFPSNSFGHETKTNAEIKSFCQSTYGVTYRLAQKGNVAGQNLQPVYNWLAHQSENGVMNGEVKDDFQKFLIDKDGALIGVFAGPINPLHNSVIRAITR